MGLIPVGGKPASAGSEGPAIPKPRLLESTPPPPPAGPSENSTPPDEAASGNGATAPMAPPPPAKEEARERHSAPPVQQPATTPSEPQIQFDAPRRPHRNASQGETTATRRPVPRRSNSSSVVVLIVSAVLLLGILGGLGGWYALGGFNQGMASSETENGSQQGGTTPARRGTTTFAATGSGEGKLDADSDPADARVVNRWSAFKGATVRIELIDHSGSRSGSGFIIDQRGWVATTYSLTRYATHALVVLPSGERFDIAGKIAESPEHGLTILKVRDAPAGLSVLELEQFATPRPRMLAFVAGDTPRPVAVQRLLAPAAIPPAARPRLPEALRGNEAIQWIEHSGKVAQHDDGSALLTANGKVIGVNVSLGTTRWGHAIHAKHLAQLAVESSDDKVMPLDPRDLASTDDPLPEIPSFPTDELGELGSDAKPDPVPDSLPVPTPNDGRRRVEDLVFRLTQCKELGWLPKREEDYAKFQDFALLLTRAKITAEAESAPAELRERLGGAVKEGAAAAAESKWPDRETMKSVNRLAVKGLKTDRHGVFAYGQVFAPPEMLRFEQFEGKTLVGFQLVGTDQKLMLTVEQNADQFKAGDVWRVIGIRDPTVVWEMTRDGDTLTARAPLVRSKILHRQPLR